MKDSEFFKLEDRVLFEAAAAAEIVEAAEAAKQDPNANVNESDRQAQQERDAVKNAPPENPVDAGDSTAVNDDPAEIADVNAAIDALIGGEIPIVSGKELVVINGSVPEKEAIIENLKPNQEILILQNGTGLDELNDFLDSSDTRYSAIHFVTHGNDGYISVNGERIAADNFDAASWQDIGEHLTEDGDILLYGCNTAASGAGKQLVNLISGASGADVAASTDLTGISGNWELEYSAGHVDTDEINADSFSHDLSSITVDTLEDSTDPDDGKTSLREAIALANDTAGEDEIVFDVAGKITLDNGAIYITDSVNIIGSGVNETIIDGNGGEIFKAGNSLSVDGGLNVDDLNLSFSNLTLQNGISATGDGGAIGIYNIGGDVNLTLENVSIIDCQAVNGGGISVFARDAVNLDVINSTIFGNKAVAGSEFADAGDGGAICIKCDIFNVNIVNSTIAGNQDSSTGGYTGGALFLNHFDSSQLNLFNSVVYGNSADAAGASDIYVSNPDPDTTPVSFRAIHSVYGNVTSGDAGETFDPTFKVNSQAGSSLTDIFGTTDPTSENGVVNVNNQGFAGYGGTLVGKDASGNYVYMNTADGSWTSEPVTVFSVDETGNSRTTAKDYLNVNEFFIGAVAGKVYLSVDPQDKTVEYDGNKHTAEVVYKTASGAVVNSAALPSGVTLTTGNITTDSKNVGIYNLNSVSTVIKSGTDDVSGKFDLVYDQTAKIEITPKALDITFTASDKMYDGTTTATLTGATITNKVTGDDLSLDYSGAASNFNDKDVANASKVIISGGLVLNGADNGNYSFNYNYETAAQITKRNVILTSGSAEKVYDGTALTNDTVNVTGDGFAAGEGAVYDVTGSQTNAGESANTFSYTLNGDTDIGNYDISTNNGTLKVAKREIVITVDPGQSITYGSDVPVLTYTVDNLVHGESLNGQLALDDPAYSSSNHLKAGDYTVTAGSVTDAANPNYLITNFNEAIFTVNKLVVKIDASVQDKTFDALDTAVITGAPVTNAVAGDNVAVDVSGAVAEFDDANAGNNKDVTISGGLELTGIDSGNYELVYDYTASGNIQAKDVTVIFETDAPYVYNGTDQSGTVHAYYTDINGNRVDVALDWDGKSFTEAGYYTVTAVIADSNYSTDNGTITLTMYAAGIGGEGSFEENTSIHAMQAELTANGTGNAVNVYTMNYAELVSGTMLDYGRGFAGEYRLLDPYSLTAENTAVSVDILRHNPMTIDAVVQESSIAGDFFAGEELFSSDAADTLIRVRGDAPVAPPESLYVENDADAEDLPWFADAVLTASLPDLAAMPEKSVSFKSDFEKLLDEVLLV